MKTGRTNSYYAHPWYEMGEECGTYGRGDVPTGFLWEDLKNNTWQTFVYIGG
jgi:hypothetical protein